MKKQLSKIAAMLAAFLLVGVLNAQAQTTVTSTTISAAMTATQRTVTLASTTGVAVGTGLYIDREAMSVSAITGSVANVIRGVDGTAGAAHVSGALVYAGPTSGVTGQGPFWNSDPNVGSCTATAEQYNLRINVMSGRVWQCTNSQWMNVIDAFIFVGPGSCNSSVSGNSTGTNGFTVLGTAPSIPVVQAQTSASGTNVHYYMCNIPLPTRSNAVKAAYLVDAVFYYGVQTTGLGTQVAVLASGTMNAKVVFTYINYPTPAASETPTGLVEATRADSGTLVITPVVGSFNVATTTAGEFYSAKFAPATPIAFATDGRQLLLTVSLLNTATSATVTNSPGFIAHYRTLQAGF